jgi:hypothetical protein
MIKFFRKIRQRLLTENKFSKYLIYAIGEIILVVIGILIALQINSWNDHRVRKSEISSIYLSIKEELENDVMLLDKYLPIFNWKNANLEKIVREDISLDEWTKNDSLFRSFASFPDFEISQERFQLLKSKVDVDNETKNLNKRISDFYHIYTVDLNVKTSEANASYNRNISYWEENEEWLSLAYVDKDYSKLGEYAVGNHIFRNKMMWYRIVLWRLENALLEYQTEAKIVIEEISEYLSRAE